MVSRELIPARLSEEKKGFLRDSADLLLPCATMAITACNHALRVLDAAIGRRKSFVEDESPCVGN